MSAIKCILCDSKEIEKLEIVLAKDLIKLYKKLTKEDFSYLIKQDLIFCECKTCGLKFFYPLVTGDEKFYNALQKFEWYYMNEKEEYNLALRYINNNDKVLEVGCGKGAFYNFLKRNGFKGKYVGLELSEKAVRLAKEREIEVYKATIEEFSETSEKFDVICSFQVLEHVSNPKTFIESMLRLLNGEGKMIISVPNEDSFIKYSINHILNMPPHHVTRWNKKVFKYIANKYNLDLKVLTEKVQPYHREWYINTMIRALLFGKGKLIDNSIIKKLIVKLICRLISRNFKNEFLPNGMSMVGVFKK